LNVEDCADAEDYFRSLADALEKSAAKGKLAKLGEKAGGVFKLFWGRITSVKLAGFELTAEAVPDKKDSYAAAFEDLLHDLDVEGTKIIIMVDEFPVAVEAIAKNHSNTTAVNFLHANRGMRQRAGQSIRFIYTGSIGLPNVARKLDPNPTINDLNIVEIPPLTQTEGLEMSQQIFAEYGIVVQDELITYMLSEIQWLTPFWIQLVIQLLIDETESEHQPISNKMVDSVLAKASNHRNNSHLASYFDRLAENLSVSDYDTAKAILAEIATNDTVHIGSFEQANAAKVLETLEYDGYIYELEGQYRFNSPILQKWWVKNAR
jgi:uncharacterized protein